MLPVPVTAGAPNDGLQLNEVGEFVQLAAKLTLVAVPETNVFGVAVGVHDGGPADTTVTVVLAIALVPPELVAVTEWV